MIAPTTKLRARTELLRDGIVQNGPMLFVNLSIPLRIMFGSTQGVSRANRLLAPKLEALINGPEPRMIDRKLFEDVADLVIETFDSPAMYGVEDETEVLPRGFGFDFGLGLRRPSTSKTSSFLDGLLRELDRPFSFKLGSLSGPDLSGMSDETILRELGQIFDGIVHPPKPDPIEDIFAARMLEQVLKGHQPTREHVLEYARDCARDLAKITPFSLEELEDTISDALDPALALRSKVKPESLTPGGLERSRLGFPRAISIGSSIFDIDPEQHELVDPETETDETEETDDETDDETEAGDPPEIYPNTAFDSAEEHRDYMADWNGQLSKRVSELESDWAIFAAALNIQNRHQPNLSGLVRTRIDRIKFEAKAETRASFEAEKAEIAGELEDATKRVLEASSKLDEASRELAARKEDEAMLSSRIAALEDRGREDRTVIGRLNGLVSTLQINRNAIRNSNRAARDVIEAMVRTGELGFETANTILRTLSE